VLDCVNVVVATGIRRNEKQKALAGFCCFSAVTSLVTTGHRAGVVAAGAGTGFAAVRATKTARTSESMIVAKKKLEVSRIDASSRGNNAKGKD
jgi:hypothetical protein